MLRGLNTALAAAYDNNLTTYAEVWSNGATDGEAIFSGFPAAAETYTNLKLQVTCAAKIMDNGWWDDDLTWDIDYSLDGGSTWLPLINPGDFAFPTVSSGGGTPRPLHSTLSGRVVKSVALAVGQDLTQIQVKARTSATISYDLMVNAALFVYEISTMGSFPLAEGAAGSLSAYSGPIFAAQNQDEIDGIAGLATRGRYGDQVITKAIAYEDDVINGGHLGGTKAELVAALASVTGQSTASFASVTSRIGRKPYYVGDSDSTFLAQTLTTGIPALYNARISAAIHADHFHKERDIQDHALGYGVEMGKHAAIDAETLRRAGLYQREYVQYGYVLSHKLFIEDMEMNVVNLEVFGNCLRALTGSQQTTTQEYSGGNKMTAAVGMGMAGGVAGWYLARGNFCWRSSGSRDRIRCGSCIGLCTFIGGAYGRIRCKQHNDGLVQHLCPPEEEAHRGGVHGGET